MFSNKEMNKKNINDAEYKKMKIKIADFEESFLCPIGYWTLSDYEKHWKDQLSKFMDEYSDKAFFITEMHNPKTANYIRWWIIYRVDDFFFFQEHMLLLKELEGHFSLENAALYVPNREIINEDGDEISEWKLSSSEFKNSFILY